MGCADVVANGVLLGECDRLPVPVALLEPVPVELLEREGVPVALDELEPVALDDPEPVADGLAEPVALGDALPVALLEDVPVCDDELDEESAKLDALFELPEAEAEAEPVGVPVALDGLAARSRRVSMLRPRKVMAARAASALPAVAASHSVDS